MAALPLTRNALHKSEMEYHGNFGHTIERIQHICLISRISICYTTCNISTQTVAPTLPGFQGIHCCVQYLDSHPHKPIFYPYNYYDGSNVIRITWSGNKVEYYKTGNFSECQQYADHARIINRRRSVSGIIHTLLGVAVCWKL